MSLPLAGRRILVTRAAEQSDELRTGLEADGARVVVVPVLAFVDPESWAPADAAIAALAGYDAVVFTSVNGVERFFARVGKSVAIPKAFAVGSRTAAALSARGVLVESLPEEFRGEALAPLVAGAKRVLLPRAQDGRDATLEALRATGAHVDAVPVYRTVIPEGARESLLAAFRTRFDAVVLASPSAATHLVELLGGLAATRAALGTASIAAIGPVTAARCEALGIPAAIVPSRYTAADLAAALDAHLRS